MAIEPVASVTAECGPRYREDPCGIYLKLSGVEGRVPIESS